MDTQSVIVKALEIDSKKLSLDPANFIAKNKFQYTLAIETWFDAIRTAPEGDKAVIAVSFDVIRQGLVATIADAVAVADTIVRSSADNNTSLPASWYWICKDLTPRSALQVLRYLKRFTPVLATALDASCYDAYIATLNRNKLRERSELCQYITTRASEVCKELLDGISFGAIMPNGIPASLFEKGYFSSGVTWDAIPNSKVAKIGAWISPFFCSPLFPSFEEKVVIKQRDGNRGYSNPLRHFDGYWVSPWLHRAKAVAVPKNYKAKRIIAEEETERQYYMQGLRTICQEHVQAGPFSKNLELDRQESQQRRCFDTRWATIDLSQASDTITVSIASEIIPWSIQCHALSLRSWIIDVQGKHYINTIYETSGSAWCFNAESYIFYSVCEACRRWKQLFTGEEYLPCYVYGDDIEVDERIATEVVEWLETLGFIVNTEKSFSTGVFRESCGVEVWDGCDVSTAYWPRKEILPKAESVESLIHLSDRMIDIGWALPHLRVLDAIRSICKDKFTTTSVLDSDVCTDPHTLSTPITTNVRARKAYTRGTEVPDYEGHMYVATAPSGVVEHNLISSLEMYRYMSFLLHGPRYESELDALLHVSTSYHDTNDERCNMRSEIRIKPRM